MISIQPSSQSKSSPTKSVHILPFLKMKDNKAIGLSKLSNLTTNADGSLYPSDANDNTNIGQINTFLAKIASYTVGLGTDTESYNNNQTKYKVADSYVNLYKRLKYMQARSYIANQLENRFLSGSDYMYVMIQILTLSSTDFILLYRSANNAVNAIIGSINASTGVITWGSPVKVSNIAGGIGACRMALIDTSTVLFIARQDPSGTEGTFVSAATISGSTITLGTAVSISGTAPNDMDVCKANTGKGTVIYLISGTYTVRNVSVSGTTCTLNSTTAVSDATGMGRIKQIATDKVLMTYTKASGATQRAVAADVTGTSAPTLGTAIDVYTSGTPSSGYDRQIVFASGAKAFVYMNNVAKLALLAISGTTLTLTNTTSCTTGNGGSGGPQYWEVVTADTVFNIWDATQTSQGAITISISGTTVTVGLRAKSIVSEQTTTSVYEVVVTALGGSILILNSNNSSETVVYNSWGGATTIDVLHDGNNVATGQVFPIQLCNVIINADYAINGQKAYVGVKNVSGAIRVIQITEVMFEVE